MLRIYFSSDFYKSLVESLDTYYLSRNNISLFRVKAISRRQPTSRLLAIGRG